MSDNESKKVTEPAAGFASPASACSASDLEMAKMLTGWKDRILHRAAINVENHFIDGPVEDFTEEQEGFERGLRTSVTEICNLMADPTYFGREPQNTVLGVQRTEGDKPT